ncbi:MAG: outer membrane protein assembly factor BamB [Myxococcota bacterium]|jgi:outer membrane protein assembly factor BamB
MEAIGAASCPSCGTPLPLGRTRSRQTCPSCGTEATYTSGTAEVDGQLDEVVLAEFGGGRSALLVGWCGEALVARGPEAAEPRWSVPAKRGPPPLIAAGGRVYACTGVGEIQAVDAGTGHVAFVTRLPAPVFLLPDGRPALADPLGASAGAVVFIHCADGRLIGASRATGESLGHWPVGPHPRCWEVGEGHLLLSRRGAVWVVRQGSDRPVVRHPVPDEGEVAGRLVGGRAFISTEGGEHVAHGLADGAEQWRAQAPWVPSTGMPAFAGVAFRAHGARVTALPSGATAELPDPVTQLFVVAGTVVAVTETGVVGLGRDLAQNWTARGRWTTAAHNGRLLVAVVEGEGAVHVAGVLPTTGRELWSTRFDSTVSHLTLGRGVALARVAGGQVAIELKRGRIVWRR